jgi:CRISPR/Cas system Type II protein with McrA/HNH and RuvC-like nuclease domain
LTKENVSIDHLKPVSKGGKTELKNIVLSSKHKNQLKGNKPLKDYIDFETVGQYLEQFIGVKFPDFDGNKYIKLILRQISELMNE